MFSQWRHAVETFAQHPPKSSQDGSADEHNTRSSLDSASLPQSLSSSSQLAESALTNLRKTLVSQRPASPGPNKASPVEGTRQPSSRSTLEDRLRAKFTIGDASTGPSPDPSSKSSRVPTPVIDHPLSPSRTPLPTSPVPVSDMKAPLSPTSTPLPDSPALIPSDAPLKIRMPQPLSPSHSSQVNLEAVAGDSNVDVKEEPKEQEAELSELTNGVESAADDTRAVAATSTEDPPSTDVPEKTVRLENKDVDQLKDGPPDVGEPELEESVISVPNHSSPQTSEEVEAGPGTMADHSPADPTPVPVGGDADNVDSDASLVVADPPTLPSTCTENEEHANGITKAALVGEVSSETLHQDESQPGTSDAMQSTRDPGSDPMPNGITDVPPVSPLKVDEPDIEGLQKRLKLVEQRFADVSTSFKRLQAEKVAADRVLRELTPLESMQETDDLRDYLQNMILKTEMAQDEIKRLTGKLTRQEERIEELRDIHRLESKSQSDLIEKLRAQVTETEDLLKVSEASSTRFEEESAKRKAETEKLEVEVERIKGQSKEEEEKRIKAIALLKTVRQKLVKAEKERDEVVKEVHALRDKGKEEREKEKAEKQKLLGEIEKVNTERETAVVGLRAQFDKEVAGLKERHERETLALRGQFELESISLKAAHSKEIDNKSSRISSLERTVQNLSKEKDDFFDQLQMRQAELESSQSLLESLQSQTTEFQYQMREATDRISLLNEELLDARRDQELQAPGSGPSTEEVTRLLSTAEARYEARLADLRRQLTAAERERDEGEAEWSRKLSDKVKEVETLKGTLDASKKNQEAEEGSIDALKKEIEGLKEEAHVYQSVISDLRTQAGKVTEIENDAHTQLQEVTGRANALQQQYEETKARESQLKAYNKTLREELRKVQSSAALLERQRNPGVGYWASKPENATEVRSPRSSVSDLASQNPNSRPGSPSTKSDEEVNFEYLRNVIMQFLEHKEMRPHLVRILSTILRFTPQETRRLVSKV